MYVHSVGNKLLQYNQTASKFFSLSNFLSINQYTKFSSLSNQHLQNVTDFFNKGLKCVTTARNHPANFNVTK